MITNCKCIFFIYDDHITNQIKASIIWELLDTVKYCGFQSILSNYEMQLIIMGLCAM